MLDYNKIFLEQYEQLNVEQKRAVDKIEGPVLLVAGPGTGKTQVLAMRIGKILRETQMNSHNILCLTFTEAAVSEMRNRLKELIGPAAYYVRIYTFHSFCNDVIRDFPEKFIFAKELEPLTEVERVEIFKEIIAELAVDSVLKPFGAPDLYLKDMMKAISALKRENIGIADFEEIMTRVAQFCDEMQARIGAFLSIHANSMSEEDVSNFIADCLTVQQRIDAKNEIWRFFLGIISDYSQEFNEAKEQKRARTKFKNDLKTFWLRVFGNLKKQNELIKVYRTYQEKLQSRGRYDFEDMILFVVRKFKEDRELLSYYQEQFQYILVDEYQDTNGAQNETVRLLGSFFENPNIFVVGDDKQSIFRFQGAALENMLFFYELYKESMEVITLKMNYRSHQGVLDNAQALISHNEYAISRYIPSVSSKLQSIKDGYGQNLEIREFENESVENYFVAKKIQELIASGVSASEVAILYRKNADCLDLIDLFLRLKIPFYVEAGQDVLKDPEINKFLDLLRFINKPEDAAILARILHYEFLGFDSVDTVKLIYFAGKNRMDLFEIVTDSEVLKKIDLKQWEKWRDFGAKLIDWQGYSARLTFSEFWDVLLKESGFFIFVTEGEQQFEILNKLQSLFEEVKKLNRAKLSLTLGEFIGYIDLMQENNIVLEEQALQTANSAVKLMTVHKAKGREFSHVFIIKCSDGNFGNSRRRERLPLPMGVIATEVSHDIQEENEEERRIFYVALTRAKEGIYLSYARFDERGRERVPAMFLQELDEFRIVRPELQEIEGEAVERLKTIFLEVPKAGVDRKLENFLRGLVDNYVMKVTHLNNYLECPRLFYYRNLLRVPEVKGKSAAYGSAAHMALEDFFVEYKRERLPECDYLLERFRHYLGREVLSKKDFQDALEHGEAHLKEFYEHGKGTFWRDSLIEYNFSSHGVNIDGVPISGKLDKVEILDSTGREVNVIDYKTGNPDSKRSELGPAGSYRRQILFYQLLCDHSPVFPYRMVSGEIVFVEKSRKEGDFKSFKMLINKEEAAALRDLIGRVYQQIKSLEFLRLPGCGKCEWCGGMAVRQR